MNALVACVGLLSCVGDKRLVEYGYTGVISFQKYMRKQYENAGKLQTRLIRVPRNSRLTKLCTAINVPVVLHSHEDRTAIMLKYRQSRNREVYFRTIYNNT
ncbi:hypothetical protein M0802_006386 [Mischocyttarus mexicanus]|nr:hypothetical protein M0802_006386 [Mischocyttarus mexicanus]